MLHSQFFDANFTAVSAFERHKNLSPKHRNIFHRKRIILENKISFRISILNKELCLCYQLQ